jgi:IS605 OrfB family transposase
MPQVKSESQMFTYQTRLSVDEMQLSIFAAFGALMGTIERTLFADLQKGKEASSLKSDYLQRFGITARQFNAIRVQVDGKIASIKERNKGRIEETTLRITSLEQKIDKIRNKQVQHLKKRRLSQLNTKLCDLQDDAETGRVRLCFGSRKLFHAQFHLEENGYASHEEWQEEWEDARCSQFFLLGSKDESGGNQSCTALLQEDGSLTLRLRLPNSLVGQFGKYTEIRNVRFSYGHEAIVASLHSCQNRSDGDKEAGVAISYRFVHDEKGWQLFASTSLQAPKRVTCAELGSIGVDINADHLAVAEVDRFGNCIKYKTIPLVLYGKDARQTKALIQEAAKEVICWCQDAKKPLVLEKLSFQEKKQTLREEKSAKQARMLSSFAYNSIIQTMQARGFRFGVEVNQVNPAYTSIIGQCKFAKKYGLTIHESAALTIARRFQGASEKLPRHLDKIPDGKGGHVTLSLPVRNRGKHVWTSWRQIRKKLLVAHAGHFRATKRRSSSRSPPACCDI